MGSMTGNMANLLKDYDFQAERITFGVYRI